MNAQEARNITDAISLTWDIRRELEGIQEAANIGRNFYVAEYFLNEEQINKLKNLGYSVVEKDTRDVVSW